MALLLNKKLKYENCFMLIISIFMIIVGLLTIVNGRNISGISIVPNVFIQFPILVLGFVVLIIEILSFIISNNKMLIIKRIALYLSILIVIYILTDFVIFGLIRNYIIAINLPSRPSTDEPLMIRLCYLWHTKYSEILSGVWTTIWLSLAGTVIGLIIALVFVSLRTLEVTPRDNEVVAFIKKIANYFVQIYVTVFRGTPMMVQAIIIFYFMPGILSSIFNVEQEVFNNLLSVGVAGLITVSLNTTAYLTEVLRGGIESLNKGQMEAARSLGMTRTQAMFYVIFPQGIKNSLPAICNEFIINIKDTSVLSVISVMDLFFIINSINGKYSNQDAIFIAAIIYLVLTFGISKLLGLLEKKMNLASKPLPSSN